MIFGLGKKNKTAPEAEPVAAEKATADEGGSSPVRLRASDLRRSVDPLSLKFKTTDDLEPAHGLIGQERAMRALTFGAGMKSLDYNIFVLGPDASGKSDAVRAALEDRAAGEPCPDDWVYANNFEAPNAPLALRLDAGRGRRLKTVMTEAVAELQATLPAAFEGEDYQARARAVDAQFSTDSDERLQELSQKAEGQGIAFLRTPMGFTFAPMLEGKVVKPEAFAAMPPSMQDSVREAIEALQEELASILQSLPRADKERRARLRKLNEEVASRVVGDALHDALLEFKDNAPVLKHLKAAQQDLVANAQTFLIQGNDVQDSEPLVRPASDPERDPRFRRYMVNPVVSCSQGQGERRAPVIEESNPTHGNLIGRIEHLSHMGALVTDFLLIKPGALHRANGGYLLIDARKLLMSPYAWEALKRALQTQAIRLEPPAEAMISTQSLDPEPIPLDVKIVLFGDRQLYQQLCEGDPEFQQLFKVQADFDDTIARTEENMQSYAGLVAAIVGKYGLKPLERDGVARLIEEGSRLAGDRDKLSIEISRLADIIREADYWSSEAGRSATSLDDVRKAIEEQTQRADRLRDRDQETFERGIVLVDTEGAKTGQINGLSVWKLGDFSFGRPNRITARVRFGPGRVVDIEREVKLGGPLHSKGVMILWGYLAGMFSQDRQLALSASLVFEQSYGGVDGDSASSTELYALLSALSDLPIKQGIAVTGSVNQLGEVQAIGGANEKIEGFFDVCKARGLTGEQGVIIPKANVQHLMLREDIVEAAREGAFHIYAVSSIEEGLEILTGVAAGERQPNGSFTPNSVFARVEDRLALFADRAKREGEILGKGAGV